MKVALVYPEKKTILSGCNPPYSLMSLGTMLAQSGIDVKLFDIDAYAKEEFFLRELKSYGPDITGLPVYFSSFNLIDRFLKQLKGNDLGGTIVLGGPEVSADPDNVLNNFPDIQFAIIGEADRSLLQFVTNYSTSRDIYATPGLVYRNGKQVVVNQHQLIEDLNPLPIPDRALLMENYKKGIYWRLGCRGSTDIIVSSRGCPYHCKFCFKVSSRARYRSAKSVHKEIEQILSMGIKNIHFMDDLLVVNMKRVKEIFDPIDPKLGIRFKVRARVNAINDEIVEYLAQKGVREIVCGYESGSDKMLSLMNKKATVQQNYKAIRTIKKYGIKAFADIFFMYPGEDFDTATQTINFIKETKPTYVNWSFFIPFTNTPITRELEAKGLLEGKYSVKQYPRVVYNYLKNGEYEKLTSYILRQMNRYNRSILAVILPNLISVLLSSGFKQYKIIFRKYCTFIYSKIFSGS